MPHECHYTGKKTTFGKTRTWRGQRITKGGFGLKPTGINRRTFKPNLQKVSAMVEVTNGAGEVQIDPKTGEPRRVQKKILVSTKAIRCGMVVKPLKRKHGYTAQQKQA